MNKYISTIFKISLCILAIGIGKIFAQDTPPLPALKQGVLIDISSKITCQTKMLGK